MTVSASILPNRPRSGPQQPIASGILVQASISGGGMPKLAIEQVRITEDGLAGDWQLNRQRHGGPNRAVCLYSEELYAWLAQQGIELSFGDLGENLTTRGIDLLQLSRGMRLRIGDCLLELTEPRTPCNSLNRWHPDLKDKMKGRAGWLARVLGEGTVRPGDSIEVFPARIRP